MLYLKTASKWNALPIDNKSRDEIKKGFFGNRDKLSIIETLYLIDSRNAICYSNNKPISFNELASRFSKNDRFLAKYITYKDWRDRGLIIREDKTKGEEKNIVKIYKKYKFTLPKYKVKGLFFSGDLISVIDDKKLGKELYDKYWLGQYGVYKSGERGILNKLDIFETIYLIDNNVLELDYSKEKVLNLARKRIEFFDYIYNVYKDWRSKGYIVKTGFKFGTHFRIYKPGTRPNAGKHIHSMHLLHVFPPEAKLLISEWARVVRVAHSVRKTFILAVPKEIKQKKMDIDFILFYRHGSVADTPNISKPKFAMRSFGEEEQIGGKEISSIMREAKKLRLQLILGIADRETAVTYYKLREIKLEASKNNYYEIDWFQP